MTARLDLVRGGAGHEVTESIHRVHVVVQSNTGRRLLALGQTDRLVLVRSAAKPFQTLPLLESGAVQAMGLPSELVALCCGSHNGEPAHLEGVRRLLEASGARATDLACGPHRPMGDAASLELARSGEVPGRVHNNCSGKHAGMLALAHHEGWDPEGYHLAGHPVQEAMAQSVARWTGVDRAELVEAVDGCGVICFGVPLEALAGAYARLLAAAESDSGHGDGAARSVVRAMTGHPWHVAGTGRLCTDVMEAGAGMVVAKVGAEGVYGAAIRLPPHRRQEGEVSVGLALKVEDGSRQAAEMALLAVLEHLSLLSPGATAQLRGRHPARVCNTLGQPVARWRATLESGTRSGGGS